MTQEPQQYPPAQQPQQPPAAYYQQPPAPPVQPAAYNMPPQAPARQAPNVPLVGGIWTLGIGAIAALLFLVGFILVLASDYGKPYAIGGVLVSPSLIMLAIVAAAEVVAGAIKAKK